MTNICHNARVVYLRQSSATLFARCNSRVLCSLAGGAVMSSSVCLYAIKCTREDHRAQCAHVDCTLVHPIMCTSTLCGRCGHKYFFCFQMFVSSQVYKSLPQLTRVCAEVNFKKFSVWTCIGFQIYIWHNSVKITTAVTGFWV